MTQKPDYRLIFGPQPIVVTPTPTGIVAGYGIRIIVPQRRMLKQTAEAR